MDATGSDKLQGRTGTEVRLTGLWFLESVLQRITFVICLTKDTFFRHFGKSSLEYSRKKAKQEVLGAYGLALDTLESQQSK